jgi:hypothetical protein
MRDGMFENVVSATLFPCDPRRAVADSVAIGRLPAQIPHSPAVRIRLTKAPVEYSCQYMIWRPENRTVSCSELDSVADNVERFSRQLDRKTVYETVRETVRQVARMSADKPDVLASVRDGTVNLTTVLALVHDANEETHVRESALALARELLERWL